MINDPLYMLGAVLLPFAPLYYLQIRTAERLTELETKMDLILKNGVSCHD